MKKKKGPSTAQIFQELWNQDMWPTGLFQQKTEGIIVVCAIVEGAQSRDSTGTAVPPQTRLIITSRSASFAPLVLQCCGWHALTWNQRHLYDFCSVWLKMGNTLLAKAFQFTWHHTRKRTAWWYTKEAHTQTSGYIWKRNASLDSPCRTILQEDEYSHN